MPVGTFLQFHLRGATLKRILLQEPCCVYRYDLFRHKGVRRAECAYRLRRIIRLCHSRLRDVYMSPPAGCHDAHILLHLSG